MQRRTLLKQLAMTAPAWWLAKYVDTASFFSNNDIAFEGPFKADWESLEHYQTPDWFRDAKFGMWAHWGPQCQPEAGDWYARGMYQEGQRPI